QRRAAAQAYRRRARQWRKRAPTAQVRAWLRHDPPPLVIRFVGQQSEVTLSPKDDAGHFDDDSVTVAAQAWRSRRTGSTHSVHPRLLMLLYRAVRRFRAPYLYLVSGYRVARSRSTSRHRFGRAADVVLPGVSLTRLAAFFRRQGFVGVGLYPQSAFVHIDVRHQSAFWIDRSAPGRRGRPRTHLRQLAKRMDRQAEARGETAVAELPADEGVDVPQIGVAADEQSEALGEGTAQGKAR
ncbi:MAG: YcbK family protein, partial [Polyangiales bacterium]